MRFWRWHNLPQNGLQDRRVNYLIGKSGKVVKTQIDSDAADPTKIVMLRERRKTNK